MSRVCSRQSYRNGEADNLLPGYVRVFSYTGLRLLHLLGLVCTEGSNYSELPKCRLLGASVVTYL